MLAKKISDADTNLWKTNSNNYKARISKLLEFKKKVEDSLDKVEKVYRAVEEKLDVLRNFSEANGQRNLGKPVFANNFE